VSPIIEALDLNKDGTIDAEELGKAAESLKKLDKNGDGKLTGEEFRPQWSGGPGGRPEGDGPGARGGRPEGQGGPGGRGPGRPPGGGEGAAGGEGRPQRPAIEQ
jgi:EF hand